MEKETYGQMLKKRYGLEGVVDTVSSGLLVTPFLGAVELHGPFPINYVESLSSRAIAFPIIYTTFPLIDGTFEHYHEKLS